MLNINHRAARSQPRSFTARRKDLQSSMNSAPAASVTACFSHSEDLEDTDYCFGVPRCQRLHGQRLHEGAGTPARAAGIRAVSSPAHPHQGEPRSGGTQGKRRKHFLDLGCSVCLQKFPWGDGNHSLFHNAHTNALPDGYESSHH